MANNFVNFIFMNTQKGVDKSNEENLHLLANLSATLPHIALISVEKNNIFNKLSEWYLWLCYVAKRKLVFIPLFWSPKACGFADSDQDQN